MTQLKNIFLPLLALVLTAGLSAQPPHKAPRKEVRAYLQQEVLPVMQPLRAEFEDRLSPDERAELADIRRELDELREARPERRPDPSSLSADEEAQRYAHHKAKRRLMARAWAIADAHEAELLDLMARTREDRARWQEELKELHQSARPGDERPPRAEGRPGGRHHRPHGPLHKMMTPVGFVLWDGEAPAPRRRTGRE